MYPQTGFEYLDNADGSFPGGVNPYTNGEVFGFYINSVGMGMDNNWFSDAALNSDGIDHMLAYYLPELNGRSLLIDTDNNGIGDMTVTFTEQTYLLAFEDLPVDHYLFDSDFNDTIFLATRVAPVPEPMSMMLLGSGLLGLVGLRRKVA